MWDVYVGYVDRDSTKTFGAFSRDTYILRHEKLNDHRADYGFETTRPVPGEPLSRGSFARWYLDRFIEASFSVRPYSISPLAHSSSL